MIFIRSPGVPFEVQLKWAICQNPREKLPFWLNLKGKSSLWRSASSCIFLSEQLRLHWAKDSERVVWTVNLTVDFLTDQKFYQSTNIHLLKLSHYLSRLSILELIQITGESSFFISWKFNFWKIIFFILVNP